MPKMHYLVTNFQKMQRSQCRLITHVESLTSTISFLYRRRGSNSSSKIRRVVQQSW